MVKGFAQVLGIGIILSMLSAIIVTRLFLRFIIRVISKPGAYGVVSK
jgi:preprotein translocase subunit SecD